MIAETGDGSVEEPSGPTGLSFLQPMMRRRQRQAHTSEVFMDPILSG
jgi:hypothetical protein